MKRQEFQALLRQSVKAYLVKGAESSGSAEYERFVKWLLRHCSDQELAEVVPILLAYQSGEQKAA